MGSQCIGNFLLGKLLSQEIALHIFLTGLCNCLHQSVSRNGQVLLNIIRDGALLVIAEGGKTASCHLYHVDKSHEFFIFTNGKLERRNLTAKLSLQLYNQLTVAGVVVVHIGNKNQTGQTVLLAHLPGLLCAGLDSRLAVYYNNRCVRNADSLLYFSYEVEISRSIQQINLDGTVLALILQGD